MVKILVTVGALIATTLFVIGTFSFQNQSKMEALEKSKDRGKLTWYAEMAKAKGQDEIAFPAPISRYALAKNLNEAVAFYDVVIAEPLESKSYAGPNDIRTWYKFRIIEQLSSPTESCSNCPAIPNAPDEMLPLHENEFLAAQFGGEVELDGIRLISKDTKFPPFEKHKQYLIFLSLDPVKKVGALRMGPWGTFSLDSNRNLKSVDENLKHQLREELRNQLDDSVDKLRERIKTKSKPTLE